MKAQALARGANLGGWARESCVSAVAEEAPGNETLLAEAMVLRTIVIHLAAFQRLGQLVSQEKIQELIDHAAALYESVVEGEGPLSSKKAVNALASIMTPMRIGSALRNRIPMNLG